MKFKLYPKIFIFPENDSTFLNKEAKKPKIPIVLKQFYAKQWSTAAKEHGLVFRQT